MSWGQGLVWDLVLARFGAEFVAWFEAHFGARIEAGFGARFRAMFGWVQGRVLGIV